MAIVLAGGGDPPQSATLDAWFRDQLNLQDDATADIAFVPHAIAPHTWSYEKAEEWLRDRDAFRDLRIETVRSLPDSLPSLRRAKSIFIMGGNTYRLLAALQSADVREAFRAIVSQSLVYGCSAGAIVMGNSILSAALGQEADENEIGITTFGALDLIGGANVLPHYVSADFGAVSEFVVREKRPCLGIGEDGGVVVRDGLIDNVGGVPIAIIRANGATQLAPNTHLRISDLH